MPDADAPSRPPSSTWPLKQWQALDARWRFRIATALLVLLALGAFAPVVRNGYIWDDDKYVQENRALREPGGLGRIWFDLDATPQYYPLVHTTYWIEYRIWGDNPTGYHVVNVLLHALAAFLLWQVLVRLCVPGAFVAAAVFAVHPVQVESVAWITERKNVLSGVFFFASLWCILRFYLPRRDEGPAAWAYAAALLAFLAALLAKTVACSMPAVALLILWWKKPRFAVRDVTWLLPFFALGAGLGLLTAWLERHHVGADWDLTLGERCLIAGRALWFYAGKLVWPADLTFIYPKWRLDVSDLGQVAAPLAAVALVALAFALRGRIGKGPVVALLCFGGMLFPALGFIDVYPFLFSYVADHFQYLPSAALITLLVGAAALLLQRAGPAVAASATVLLLAALTTLTARQTLAYRDLETLWRDTLAKNDGAWIAHLNLGNVLVRRKSSREAIHHYDRCLALKPDHAKALTNRGVALATLGDIDGAIAMLRRALQFEPDEAFTHFFLGELFLNRDRLDDAIAAYRTALRLDPDLVFAHVKLAEALTRAGRADEAAAHRRVAQRLRE